MPDQWPGRSLGADRGLDPCLPRRVGDERALRREVLLDLTGMRRIERDELLGSPVALDLREFVVTLHGVASLIDRNDFHIQEKLEKRPRERGDALEVIQAVHRDRGAQKQMHLKVGVAERDLLGCRTE
jgi:hypothetical protein